MDMTAYRNNLITINLAAIRENVAAVSRSLKSGTALMAVVKAEGYGHGILQTAKAALQGGAGWLGVALPEEGVLLRQAGIDAPILILGAATEKGARAAAAYGLSQTVFTPQMVRWLEAGAEKAGKAVFAHVKIDTGMNRIGTKDEAEFAAVMEVLSAASRVRTQGVYTHFSVADDEADDSFTVGQIDRFEALTAALSPGILRHAANSAGIIRFPEAHYDMVRLGIAMYGCPPVKTDIPLRPAMTWKTEIVYIKDITPGETVGYGRRFKAETACRVATLPVGYGDGYHRAASGHGYVLIGGQRAPILGTICMDQMMVDVTGIPAAVGDEAVLLGSQGSEVITAERLGGFSGTISYEALLAPTSRVPKVYIDE